MKKYLNTLFVTAQNSYLNKEGETVVVNVEREKKLQLPVHNLQSVVCFGNVSVSPFLMHHCAANGVGISFLSENGRFLARVQGPVNGNILLRKAQYKAAENEKESLALAKSFVLGKAVNARGVLCRAVRDHADKPGMCDVEQAAARIALEIKKLQRTEDLETLRGTEGEIARVYFSVFDRLITAQKKDFCFNGRTRRPPTDNVNALLSFVYTLLARDCACALEAVGLDPQCGFLHADRPGRDSLALDVMEEFRAFVADRLVLSLINLKQVSAKGFKQNPAGGVEMDDETRKTVLTAYQKRKAEVLKHPFLEETAELGLFFHLQALLLARRLRKDLDAYPPAVWR